MDGKTTIYNPDSSELITIVHGTDSHRRWQVMGEHAVTLKFDYKGFLAIPIGSYITFKGRRYTLYNPSGFKKDGTRQYGYTLKLYAYQALMDDVIFINKPDGRTSFTRTARPHEFLEALVWNMNGRPAVGAGSEWTIGAYIDAAPQTIAFNETTCAEAMRLFAETFKTEWEVDGKRTSLRKVEYFKNAPIKLQYGQGNGIQKGLERKNYDNYRPVNRLFVSGGERNIDFSTYGSQTLLLPAGQSLSYDGTYFEDQEGFNSTIARTYTVSGDGRSLIRTDSDPISNREGSLDLSEIYPMREGEVTGVEVLPNTGDGENDYYDFFDNTIPAALDYSKCLMPGQKMVVVFQSGMLAGREFDIESDDEGNPIGYVHVDPNDPTKNRRFKLVSQMQDGLIMPGGNFIPRVGDRYAVFGMSMPAEYIREDATKSGASWDLFRESARYKYENEDLRFTYECKLNPLYAQANWDELEDRIRPGGYIDFSDPQFEPDGVLIRISAIKEYLHQEKKPELDLSNVVFGGGVRGEISKIEQQEVVIDERIRDIGILSNRQWRDTMELKRRLSDLHLGFTEAITPISVQAMQMIAGSEQLQFRFVNNRTNPTEVRPTIVYNPTENTLQVQGGIIQHMTLGIDAISGKHELSEYKFWNVNALTTGPLEEDKLYWLYARVPKTGTANGTFVVTTEDMPFDTNATYYYLLVGALNSEYNGDRSYTSLYGFTEILPGQIIVNLIRSNDGKNFIDFVKNAVHIGDENTYIDWDAARKSFILKGTIVQSPSGANDAIGVFRGNYDTSGRTTYYKGEEVFHKGATYRYINSIPQAGIEPGVSANWSSYWAVKANAGKYTAYVYQAAASKPSRPSGTALIPSGWSAQPPSIASGDSISNLSYSGANWTNSGDYKRSPAIGNSGITKQRLTFTTSKANAVVNFEIYASSESGYDFMLIGQPNNSNLSRESYYTDRVSGDGVSKIVSVRFPNAGTNYIEFAYAKDGSSTGGSDYGMWRVSSGTVVWASTSVVEMNDAGEWVATEWSEPVQWTGASGKDGKDGLQGRMLNSVGEYDPYKTYKGDDDVSQVVKYNGQYWYSKNVGGTFSGRTPSSTSDYWTSFGASFESIATGLLLAEIAYIDKLIVNRLCRDDLADSPRMLASGNELGFYKTLAAESRTSNALIRLGLAVGIMSTDNSYKPGVVLRDQDGDGSYTEVTTEGIFTNGSNINSISLSTGQRAAVSIAALLQKRVSGILGGASLNAAVYGVDQTEDSSTPYSEGYGGYFNKLRANGLYVNCKRVNTSTVLYNTDVYISCTNTSVITITLPTNPYVGQIIMIRPRNASVTISGSIHTINGTVSNITANVGWTAFLVFDGSSWVNSWLST